VHRSSCSRGSATDPLLNCQYTPHHKKKSATSFPSFSRSSRGGELDDPLTLAKISMARLETTFLDSAKTVEKLSKSRRLAATAVNELGDQTTAFAMSEAYAPLAGGFKRLARSIKVDADLAALQVGRFRARYLVPSRLTILSDNSLSTSWSTLAMHSCISLRTLDLSRKPCQTAIRSRKIIVPQSS